MSTWEDWVNGVSDTVQQGLSTALDNRVAAVTAPATPATVTKVAGGPAVIDGQPQTNQQAAAATTTSILKNPLVWVAAGVTVLVALVALRG